jgi:hypothetical protein
MTAHSEDSSQSASLSLALHYLSFAILVIPAIQPLLTADFTCGYDNTFHLWRAVETANLLGNNGIVFSRWAPNMAHGYGYPLFNFAAPGSTYGPALLSLLGLPWSWALNIAFAVGWILSAFTMYLFASDILGRSGGTIAAVLYTYAPFHAYDVFYRGSLSQASAWFLPPLILWGLRRPNRRIGFATSAIGFAGLVLTHNAFALLFTPLLLGYALVVGYQHSSRTAVYGTAALLMGLGLSAFFWFPALAELGFVHSEQLTGAWVFEYANNFLPIEQLLSPPRTADVALINDWPPRGLGLIPALLAGIGLITALRNRQLRVHAAFFAVVLVTCLFLTLPISQPLWDALPLLQRVQFPWRLVGPATLCAAVLAGASLASDRSASHPIAAGVASLLLVGLLILGHLGWLYPRHCPPPGDISTAGMIDWERATDTLGSTAKSEYLPIWVEHMPDDDYPLYGDESDTKRPVPRLPAQSLPEGTLIVDAAYGPTESTVELDTPVSFEARYQSFYYPGWHVTIDGNPVSAGPTETHGLLGFHVPSGQHTIHVRFGETALRLASDVVSLLSLGALATILLTHRFDHSSHHIDHRSGLTPVWSVIAAILLVAIKITILDRVDNPIRRSNLLDGHLRHVDVSAEVTFGDEFVLLGHDAIPQSVGSGGRIRVNTFWRALQPGGVDYGVAINIVDTQGYRWSGPDVRPTRWHRVPPPVYEWSPSQYASVDLDVPLLAGTPPGTYGVEAVVFDRDTLAPLTAYDASMRTLGPSLLLGHVTVLPPAKPCEPDSLNIQHRLESRLGPLTLLGADFDRDQATPGDPMFLTVFWRVDQQPNPDSDLTLRLALLDPDGSVAAMFDLPPTTGWHPTSTWKPGQVWRGQHLLHLPADLEGGDHTWRVTLEPIQQSTSLPSLTHIAAPLRALTPPPIDLEIGVRLGGFSILGISVEPGTSNLSPGTPVTVLLVWHAEQETRTSYHVFLHLLDSAGRLIAQSDGIPANWTRPTTGWLPGEYITDVRVLTIPPDADEGRYTLLTGMYVPGAERLTTPAGEDTVRLATLTVETQ